MKEVSRVRVVFQRKRFAQGFDLNSHSTRNGNKITLQTLQIVIQSIWKDSNVIFRRKSQNLVLHRYQTVKNRQKFTRLVVWRVEVEFCRCSREGHLNRCAVKSLLTLLNEWKLAGAKPELQGLNQKHSLSLLPSEIPGDCTAAVQVPGVSSRGLPTATSPNFCGWEKERGVQAKQISILLRNFQEYFNNTFGQSESVAN